MSASSDRLHRLFWVGAFSVFLAAPTWLPTGLPPLVGRIGASATLYVDGRVLLAGGSADGGAPLTTAEWFDPTPSTWTAAPPLSQARMFHTATMLRGGDVLVVGGVGASGELATAEVFDRTTSRWLDAGTLSMTVSHHTATLLLDGTVLVPGSLNSARYDPDGGTWTAIAPMATARGDYTAVRLADGRVFVAGGAGPNSSTLATTELFDPATLTWRAGAPMPVARRNHTATLLASGLVAVVAGETTGGQLLDTTDLYDPANNSWTSLGSSLPFPREDHTATLIPMGDLIGAGGLGPNGTLSDANRLDSSQSWNWVPSMSPARTDHAAVVLATGRVLTVGGQESNNPVGDGGYAPDGGFAPPLDNAGVFDVFCHDVDAGPPMQFPRWQATATLLPDGTVLVAGGGPVSGSSLASVELFDPVVGVWHTPPPMAQARRGHTATLLLDGRVMVVGGDDSGPLASVELFDPATSTWSAGSPLTNRRELHGAVLLPNGRVLIAGGTGTTGPVADTEVWDPVTQLWTSAGALATPRVGQSMTLLANGHVLLAGGTNAAGAKLTTTALYDPATQAWTPGASMPNARASHQAVPMLDATVMFWGGAAAGANQDIYVPGSGAGTWRSLSVATFDYSRFSAVPLPTGEAAFLGGAGTGGAASNECYLYKTVIQDLDAMDTGTPPALYDRAGVLLPDGKVLFVGGRNGAAASAAVDLLDDGRYALRSLTPTLAPPPVAFPGATLQITGAGFTGLTEGSSGNWHSSAADFPILFLYREDNQAAQVLPVSQWTATTAQVTVPPNLAPGLSWARMVVMGAPSVAQPLWVKLGTGSACGSSAECATSFCVSGICASQPADAGPGDAGTGDAGAVDGGAPGPIPTYRISCGCSGTGPGAALLGLCAAAWLARRRGVSSRRAPRRSPV